MNTRMRYTLAVVFVIAVVIVAIILLHKEDPSFSEYIENNITGDNFIIEDDFALYTDEVNNELITVKNYFSALGIKGNIFECQYLKVEDGNYASIVSDNAVYGDTYYIISDNETGREYAVVIIGDDILYEELVY